MQYSTYWKKSGVSNFIFFRLLNTTTTGNIPCEPINVQKLQMQRNRLANMDPSEHHHHKYVNRYFEQLPCQATPISSIAIVPMKMRSKESDDLLLFERTIAIRWFAIVVTPILPKHQQQQQKSMILGRREPTTTMMKGEDSSGNGGYVPCNTWWTMINIGGKQLMRIIKHVLSIQITLRNERREHLYRNAICMRYLCEFRTYNEMHSNWLWRSTHGQLDIATFADGDCNDLSWREGNKQIISIVDDDIAACVLAGDIFYMRINDAFGIFVHTEITGASCKLFVSPAISSSWNSWHCWHGVQLMRTFWPNGYDAFTCELCKCERNAVCLWKIRVNIWNTT